MKIEFKILMLLNVLLYQTEVIFCQEIKPLKLGESAPDFYFETVAGSTNGPIRLSNLKKKLIILDFWSKSCSACIAGFPRLNDLQKRFGSAISILLVTENNMEDYKMLKERSAILNSIELPIVLSEPRARKYFPNTFLPYQVWLDENLKVVALTDGYNTNQESIQGYLSTGYVPEAIQKNYYLDFNRTASILTEGNGRNLSSVTAYSVVLSKLQNVSTAFRGFLRLPNTLDIIGVKMINASLYNLCYTVFPEYTERMEFQPRRANIDLSAEVIDSLFTKERFCYEMRMPQRYWANNEHLRRAVLEDLQRYFGIDTLLQPRTVFVHKLRRVVGSSLLKPSSDGAGKFISEFFYGKLVLKNAPLQGLLTRLSLLMQQTYRRMNIKTQFKDETGLTANYNLELDISESPNLEGVNAQLSKYGLYLAVEKEEQQFLILQQQ